jgi:hypothetical protein
LIRSEHSLVIWRRFILPLFPAFLNNCYLYAMKADIPIREVEDIAVAIIPPLLAPDSSLWEVYLINLKGEAIENVLISSRGYGEQDGEEINTSVLRHFIEELGPLSYHKIEEIQTELFVLNNEYWVSFSYDNFLFDRKYVFGQGTISADNFTRIPFINREGVLLD